MNRAAMLNIINNPDLHYLRKVGMLRQLATTLSADEDFQDRSIVLAEARRLENAVIDSPILSDQSTALINLKKICLYSNPSMKTSPKRMLSKTGWLTYSSVNYLTLRNTAKIGMLSLHPHDLVSPARDLANIAATMIQKTWRNRQLAQLIKEAFALGHHHARRCGQSCLCCRSEAARTSGEWFSTCIVCDLIHIDENKINFPPAAKNCEQPAAAQPMRNPPP